MKILCGLAHADLEFAGWPLFLSLKWVFFKYTVDSVLYILKHKHIFRMMRNVTFRRAKIMAILASIVCGRETSLKQVSPQFI